MILENQYSFQGPRAVVWELLLDPTVLAHALPGTQKLERIDDNRYQGTMQARVGPLSGTFAIDVELRDMVHPEHYAMQIDGKGALGFVTGTANVQLHEPAPNTTVMQYKAELQIGGKLAIVGQRLLDTVGKSMARQGLEAMSKILQERLQGGAAGGGA